MSILKVTNGTDSSVEVSLSFSGSSNRHLGLVGKYANGDVLVGLPIEGLPDCVDLDEPGMLTCIEVPDEEGLAERILPWGHAVYYPARYSFGEGRTMPCWLKFERLAA